MSTFLASMRSSSRDNGIQSQSVCFFICPFVSSIFFESLYFRFLLDGLLLLESDLGLFMFLGSGKRTTHLTLWTLETSTFLIFLICSFDCSTAKFLADIGLIVPRLFSFATLTNVSVLKSLLFCSSQDSPTEFSSIFYSFNRSTSVRLSPSEC